MKTNKLGRRDFFKYCALSSLFVLSGCSSSKRKLVLRGISSSFPSEFIDSLSSDWEFLPIKDIQLKKNPYNFTLQEKTDLLVLNDGWISKLTFDSLKEIKASKIRNNFTNQTNSFLDGLGEEYKNKILPIAVSPWVLLIRNEDSLALKNRKSWEVIFSSSLTNQIVFPNSPYLLMSIARKIGFLQDISKIKSQARSFDDRNALNWVVSGRANAALLPFSSCVDSLIKDPRLSVLLPQEGSPLNWTVLASPALSLEAFSSDWFELLWGPTNLRRVIRKGYLPPTSFTNLRSKNFNISRRYQSVFLPEENIWNKCWSLSLLNDEDKRKLALTWNNS